MTARATARAGLRTSSSGAVSGRPRGAGPIEVRPQRSLGACIPARRNQCEPAPEGRMCRPRLEAEPPAGQPGHGARGRPELPEAPVRAPATLDPRGRARRATAVPTRAPLAHVGAHVPDPPLRSGRVVERPKRHLQPCLQQDPSPPALQSLTRTAIPAPSARRTPGGLPHSLTSRGCARVPGRRTSRATAPDQRSAHSEPGYRLPIGRGCTRIAPARLSS
jgi:hypothetical protein